MFAPMKAGTSVCECLEVLLSLREVKKKKRILDDAVNLFFQHTHCLEYSSHVIIRNHYYKHFAPVVFFPQNPKNKSL